jgi:hypothetical protein
MKKSILILFSIFTFSIAFTQSGYNLEFSQAILVENSTMTVPSGKVWKVVSVQRGDFDNYTTKIEINGSVIYVGGGYQDGVTQNQRVTKFSETFPIWLPSGSTIKAGTGIQFISVVEFNLISN